MTTVKDPADLLSAVPFLLGYHPENSLVIISVKNDALEMAMRVDFPDHTQDLDKGLEVLTSHLVRENSEGALAVAYTDSDSAELVLNALGAVISSHDIAVRELLLVSNGRFRSVICEDKECCPAEGNPLPDFTASRLTAEQVAEGKVLPFASSEGLVNSLKANDLSTDKDFIALVQGVEVNIGDSASQQIGANLMTEFSNMLMDNQVISNELKAKALAHLTDIQVRDFALGAFYDPELARGLFIDLTRCAPKGFVAPVASLASAYAYEAGNGAEAHRLLDRAIEDNSDYSLARLLRRVFSSGWPPAGFKQLRSELHGKVTATIYGEVPAE